MSLSRSRLSIRIALGCLVAVIGLAVVGCSSQRARRPAAWLSRTTKLPISNLRVIKLPMPPISDAKRAISKISATKFPTGKLPIAKLSAAKISAAKISVPKLSVPQFKVPEFKVPPLPKASIKTPAFVSKLVKDKPDETSRKFKLASTAQTTVGAPRELVHSSAQSTTADRTPDTMALVDEASERVQDAFSDTSSAPLADSSNGHDGTPSIQDALRPRDANSQPDHFRDLSESDMLRIALSQSPILKSLGIRILDNPQAATTIYDVAIDESDPFFGPQAALAEFDSRLSASFNSQNNDRVFNNATLGGQVQELTQDLVNINAGWQRRTTTGATWEINSLTGYDNNNRAGNRFHSYWETQLELGVRQPLLQGAGKTFNRIAGPNAQPGFNFSNGIVIARMNNQISQADFELALRSYVRDLYSAYWDLVRQYTVYQNVLQSQDLAYKTWQTVLAKGKAELEGGEANKEAQARAKYYNYRREVQIALGGESGRGGLYTAERQLRQLIGLPAVDGQILRPTDTPVTARYVFDYDHLVNRAVSGRTELRRQCTKIRQQELRLIAAKNFLLPQMDLVGRYRLRGFGDDLTGGGPRFSSAWDDFTSLDHQEWEFGVEMGVTAGRRQAHAAVRNAKLQLSRERSILNEQQRMVQHEISEAYAEVSSAFYAMDSSRNQVDASRERLEASEALFDADKIQIEFLLDAQEELLRAELQLASDQARYCIALVEINNSSGTLLQDIGVNISQSQCGTQVRYFNMGSAVPEIPSSTSPVIHPGLPESPTPDRTEPVERPIENVTRPAREVDRNAVDRSADENKAAETNVDENKAGQWPDSMQNDKPSELPKPRSRPQAEELPRPQAEELPTPKGSQRAPESIPVPKREHPDQPEDHILPAPKNPSSDTLIDSFEHEPSLNQFLQHPVTSPPTAAPRLALPSTTNPWR